jgi:hypothetical protein
VEIRHRLGHNSDSREAANAGVTHRSVNFVWPRIDFDARQVPESHVV